MIARSRRVCPSKKFTGRDLGRRRATVAVWVDRVMCRVETSAYLIEDSVECLAAWPTEHEGNHGSSSQNAPHHTTTVDGYGVRQAKTAPKLHQGSAPSAPSPCALSAIRCRPRRIGADFDSMATCNRRCSHKRRLFIAQFRAPHPWPWRRLRVMLLSLELPDGRLSRIGNNRTHAHDKARVGYLPQPERTTQRPRDALYSMTSSKSGSGNTIII
jgi:hypothetical protein